MAACLRFWRHIMLRARHHGLFTDELRKEKEKKPLRDVVALVYTIKKRNTRSRALLPGFTHHSSST